MLVLLAGCVAVVPVTITTTHTVQPQPQRVAMRYAPAGSVSARVGAILNEERTKRGLQPVSHNATMDELATAHARDMHRNDFFGHEGTNGRSSFQRLKSSGYGPCIAAENIARGQRTPEHVMQSWMESDGHRENNLRAEVSEYGVGYETAGHNWVLMLAAPGC